MTKDGTLKKVYNEWTLVGALTASGLPAAIYALQNSLLQISYKNLDSLTFSMLNQTKIFFTAFFTYFIMRYVPEWHLFNSCCCCCCFGMYGFSENCSSVKANNLLCTIINRSWRIRRCLCSFGWCFPAMLQVVESKIPYWNLQMTCLVVNCPLPSLPFMRWYEIQRTVQNNPFIIDANDVR